MTTNEELLINLLRLNDDKNAQAYILQAYIQQNGPLSDECRQEVNMILGEPVTDSRQQS